MNSKRRIAIACAALTCVVGVLWMNTDRQRPQRTYTYSQFLDQVDSGQIASVVVIGSNSGAVEATCRLKDGKSARTVLPSDYRDALTIMQSKLVNIEIRGSSSTRFSIFINAMPIFLLFALWLYVMSRKLPNGALRFSQTNT